MPPEDTQDPPELELRTLVSCPVYVLGFIFSFSSEQQAPLTPGPPLQPLELKLSNAILNLEVIKEQSYRSMEGTLKSGSGR